MVGCGRCVGSSERLVDDRDGPLMVGTGIISSNKEWTLGAGPAHSAQPTSRPPFHSFLSILKASRLMKSTWKHSQNQHPFGAIQCSDTTLHLSEHKFLEFWGSFWRCTTTGWSFQFFQALPWRGGRNCPWVWPHTVISILLISVISPCDWGGLSDSKGTYSQQGDEKELWKMRKWGRETCF